MTDLNDRLDALQRTVRRLQFTVFFLGASLLGLLFMAQAPQNELKVRELKAERIVVGSGDRSMKLLGDGLILETGTKDEGASASFLPSGLRFLRFGPQGSSGVFVETGSHSARVYGMTNNGKKGSEYKERTFELNTAAPVEAKRDAPPPF